MDRHRGPVFDGAVDVVHVHVFAEHGGVLTSSFSIGVPVKPIKEALGKHPADAGKAIGDFADLALSGLETVLAAVRLRRRSPPRCAGRSAGMVFCPWAGRISGWW